MTFPRVGVIGAGQLARMMIAPATELGIDLHLLATNAEESAAQIVSHEIGRPDDLAVVLKFAQGCDVVTFEHEQIPQSVIKGLEQAGVRVYPRSESFLYSQNKLAMREKMQELGLPNPAWEEYLGGGTNLQFPLIAKAVTGGYDGRGVFVIKDLAELQELAAQVSGSLLLEEKLNFSAEIAVMVARSPHGQAATWAPIETVQRDGICTMTITPAPSLSEAQAEAALQIALKVAQGVNLVGVMAVEMFVVEGQLVINELAMRPHNSGHFTIEGSVTSQFEQHLRAVLDLPLGSTELTAPLAVMGNVFGGEKPDMYRPYLHLMARTPGLKFHHYRKEVKPGRKIGHVTLLGNDLEFLRAEVAHALAYMSGEIDE